jgi:hypothetical protein
MNIITLHEGKRGCGYRKPGGIYLVTEGQGRFCGALPIELSVCPTCHQGIKPARGWTWIDLKPLRAGKPCVQSEGPGYCYDYCPLNTIGKAGLIWIGEKFYKTTEAFNRESAEMGISRRISQIPRGFKLGETWVALAHRKAVERTQGLLPVPDAQKFAPGIFHLFKPQAIQYVVKDTDTKEKLEALEKRGITLVKVVPRHSPSPLEDEVDERQEEFKGFLSDDDTDGWEKAV